MGSVQAGPTKEFFIDMITRDIQLEKAILDLIDNSIDGAKRSGIFEGKEIMLTMNKDKFQICDNCGGFSINIAENYAFKFGRTTLKLASENQVEYSIGRFGVGMKRTLFKLGNRFKVESRTEKEHFTIEVDVNEWKSKDDELWNFELKKQNYNKEERWTGTRITVTELNSDIIQSFAESELANSSLKSEIGYSYAKLINKGLKIIVNGMEINASDVEMIYDDEIRPSVRKLKIAGTDIQIIAGISEAKPSDAGWYIYANDRLLLMADKSKTTGWGVKGEDLSLPQFHASKAMFRGVVFMNSKDVTKLPLTTTKVGVDVDSELYKTILQHMGMMMKEIFIYLNQINDKTDRDEIYNNHDRSIVFDIRKNYKKLKKEKFIFSVNIKSIKEKDAKIIYSRSRELADRIKKEYDLGSYKEVGEYTFDYFVDMECL
ncbi:ATP-binding protein [Clostridium sp. A1-XYC3]|uniref:ATP-binding protein n=1 Tax=Clostridium tanneri TaxID=3037988 RepID=A0ABU4JWZ0_9CLOT|nr:ATP-binding protein [Clostridium sp. A1-XYC3]MDW8802461.1 ATP-binding protein [Clostridium sp. A1-XYC3]